MINCYLNKSRSMSLYNTTNIKNLPQVDQIIDTDFLVVENYAGTNKLKFKDFVVGPNNTSFYTSIKTNLSELSAYDKTLTTSVSTLSSNTNTFNRSISAKLDSNISITNTISSRLDTSIIDNNLKITNLTNNVTVTADNLTSTVNNLNSIIAQISEQYPIQYNKLFTFRWDLSAYSITPNYSRSFTYLFVDLPYELKTADIVYVRPHVGIDDEFNYNGSITFKLSTVFFNGEGATSTYALMLTSNIPVPESMTYHRYYPGTSTYDRRTTFICRVITTATLNSNV